MKLDDSILENVRESMGLTKDNREFDTELTNHINMSIGKLNQAGMGKHLMVHDETSTWSDLLDVTQTEGNLYVGMVPTFVSLNVKLLFDPPPPSSVEFHTSSVNELLWRLQVAYDDFGREEIDEWTTS